MVVCKDAERPHDYGANARTESFFLLSEYLPEVEPVDREGDREREEPRPSEQGPEEQLPVLEPLLADNAESYCGLEPGHDIINPETSSTHRSRMVSLQKCFYSCVVVFR